MTKEKTAARRERRIAARKAQILDAAAKVFAEKGFTRATTREIADVADVSEGTIYNYFSSKEDLLIAMMARVAEMQLSGIGLTFSEKQQGRLGEYLGHVVPQGGIYNAREFFVNVLRQRHSFVQDNQVMLQALLSEILVNPELRVRYNQQLVAPFLPILEQQVQKYADLGQARSGDMSLAVRFVSALNLGLLGMLILGDSLLEEKWMSEELIQQLADFVMKGLGFQVEE